MPGCYLITFERSIAFIALCQPLCHEFRGSGTNKRRTGLEWHIMEGLKRHKIGAVRRAATRAPNCQAVKRRKSNCMIWISLAELCATILHGAVKRCTQLQLGRSTAFNHIVVIVKACNSCNCCNTYSPAAANFQLVGFRSSGLNHIIYNISISSQPIRFRTCRPSRPSRRVRGRRAASGDFERD